MNFCLTVDDVGYEGFSTEAHFANLLDTFQQMEIRATFFTVPIDRGVPINQRKGYVALLRRAVEDGHEIAQHGLEHDRFEVGIPPSMIMEMPSEGPARKRLANERDAIEASLQIDGIRARLRRGRQILEEAVDTKIVGFRAPCLATCTNLFYALDAEGYRYDSSLHLQEAGWDILNEKDPLEFRTISRYEYQSKQHPGKLLSFPLTTEYTWYLPWKRFDITFDLAKHDFLSCMQIF
jgi:peptidoglycan/xylan/chitin deacetylase (PgdA/CDA1 family)